MKITKKELFKFCDENNDAINELQSQSDSTDFLLAVLIQQLKDSGVIDEINPEPKPQLKQLDQSIFDGLDEKWRFAAVDRGGLLKAFTYKPKLSVSMTSFILLIGNTIDIGTGYDASNWQNSLIERDIAKELLEIDLSSELTGSDLALELLKNQRYIIASVSDVSDADAIECSNNKLIHKSSEDIFTDDMGGIYCWAVALNNQGEPLTASEVGL